MRLVGCAAIMSHFLSVTVRRFNSAVVRMATLATSGRIGSDDVDEEVSRLKHAWEATECTPAEHHTAASDLELPAMDRFDELQLREVISVCRGSRSLSEAGRKLFAVSRLQKNNPNDADRLRKYLAQFDLTFERVRAADRG